MSGVVHRRSGFSLADTVERLSQAIDAAGARLFCLIDQRAEAERIGLSLRPTTILIFGNPAAGTKVMEEAPVAALDLPLKVLVWEDNDGTTWMTYLAAEWLADRYQLRPEAAAPLAAVDRLTAQVAEGAPPTS